MGLKGDDILFVIQLSMFLVDKSQFDWSLFLGKHGPVDKQCILFALQLNRSPREREKQAIRQMTT